MDSLIGIRFNTWRELLKENHYSLEGQGRGIALRITLMSVSVSRRARLERRRYGDQVAAAQVRAPLFVLGHWRSGTTMLHNMLVVDKQFSYPTIFQVGNAHTFLAADDDTLRKRYQNVSIKRPMDNIRFDPFTPGEDEFALSAMSIRSPLTGWSFPRHQAFYDRFLTFREAAPEELERWRNAFELFIRKLTVKYPDKRLLLKSPPHTARVRLLLELFPDAQFVHIYRNPYDVFRSTLKLYETGILPAAFHAPPPHEQVVEDILRRYNDMFDAYLEEQALIPEGQLVEVSYEDLEANKIGTVAHVYERLKLDGYAAMEAALHEHVESIKGYRKNDHSDMPPVLRQQITTAWERNFDLWGYPQERE